VIALVAAACTGSEGSPPATSSGATTSGGDTARRAVPDHPARGQLAPTRLPSALGPLTTPPGLAPTQVAWRDAPVPTNQWWTSLATSTPARLFLHPLAVDFRDIGMEIASPSPTVSADEVVNDWKPFARIATAGRPRVVGWGDFSVTAEIATPSGATLTSTLAQGLPAVALRSTAGSVELELLAGPTTLATADGRTLADATAVTASALVATTRTDRWDLRSDRPITWQRRGQTLSATVTEPTVLTLAYPPGDVDATWTSLLDQLATHPVTSTTATAVVGDGVVTHTLRFERDIDAPVPVALLPHQRAASRGGVRALGTYPSERGTLTLADRRAVVLDVAFPGLLLGPPPLGAPPADLASLVDLDRREKTVRPGSYFGARDLGRLAGIVDGLDAYGSSSALNATRDALLREIADELTDRLTYSGPADDRWLAAEPTWGGIIALPTEFVSERYNDLHFHFAYVIEAAALIAEQRGIDKALRDTIDLLASSVMAVGVQPLAAISRVDDGIPLGGGHFSPWLGHSLADGFATSNRGNNQESSSEAVHAWYAIARWAHATDRPEIGDAAAARYGMETRTAQTYWLDAGSLLPDGYRHDTAGIVWGDRVEYRTFFSPKAEAIVGIQLLPFSFGSLYRNDVDAARRRSTALFGVERMWPDVHVLDVAVADPTAARAGLAAMATRQRAGGTLDVQGGTSYAFSSAWIAMLDRFGTPDDRAMAVPGMARAFTRADGKRSVVAVNPTSKEITVKVRWTDSSAKDLSIKVPARGSVVADVG
jgi:endo-1,3(4)-beta-glucanase